MVWKPELCFILSNIKCHLNQIINIYLTYVSLPSRPNSSTVRLLRKLLESKSLAVLVLASVEYQNIAFYWIFTMNVKSLWANLIWMKCQLTFQFSFSTKAQPIRCDNEKIFFYWYLDVRVFNYLKPPKSITWKRLLPRRQSWHVSYDASSIHFLGYHSVSMKWIRQTFPF